MINYLMRSFLSNGNLLLIFQLKEESQIKSPVSSGSHEVPFAASKMMSSTFVFMVGRLRSFIDIFLARSLTNSLLSLSLSCKHVLSALTIDIS